VTVGRVGFYAGLTACAFTIAYDVVQLLQVAGVVHVSMLWLTHH
jgi:hypothetical protein